MLSSDSPAPGGAADISASAAAASPHPFPSLHITTTTTTTTTTAATKRKRRPAGTPDPDAEVVSLSPRTLLESDRYVCEICNQGFQRDQNLQMHRRRHKVPWKLLKREGAGGGGGGGGAGEVRKRVYVCPEPSCLHHDPGHALGDLVGIKKHFRRKHSSHRQWVCARCSKAYAVQSDYKAHLKTCGTRGHSCDCGRVFSRVESFIEHQDQCTAGRAGARADLPSAATAVQPACPSLTALLPSAPACDEANATKLRLSIGPEEPALAAARLEEEAAGQFERARRQRESAEQELANARRIRHQAQVELSRAIALRDHAVKQINATLLQITCCSCKSRFRAKVASCRPDDDNSLAASYVSSAVTGGEDAKNREHNNKVAKMAAT
uniref:C2H2-type domain-containing protein n=1 Tax=Ananas comosus var. bracteatus TaxID=296719 RepID=A0A6V7P5R3_ANACO|nr:unnamed protein product [Ananas comosus var. bracteatus]